MKYLLIIAISSVLIYFNTDDTPGSRLERKTPDTPVAAIPANKYYTHALWRVKPGKEAEFVEAFKKFSNTMAIIAGPPGIKITLIQSLSEPLIFYSFTPWGHIDNIHTMRNDIKLKNAISVLSGLCIESRPFSYKTILELSYP